MLMTVDAVLSGEIQAEAGDIEPIVGGGSAVGS